MPPDTVAERQGHVAALGRRDFAQVKLRWPEEDGSLGRHTAEVHGTADGGERAWRPPSGPSYGPATTQPLPVGSKALLLQSGCTANWWLASWMFCVFSQAHLSPFSDEDASFHPS